jgi:hypothetical protein
LVLVLKIKIRRIICRFSADFPSTADLKYADFLQIFLQIFPWILANSKKNKDFRTQNKNPPTYKDQKTIQCRGVIGPVLIGFE